MPRDLDEERARLEEGTALGRATPAEVVDLLLWALIELAGSITIVPDGTMHAIRHELGGASTVLATVPASFGDALAARLSLVAGLDVGVPGAQIGRLRVRPGLPAVDAPVTELIVAVRTTRSGLEAEVHRMAASVAPPNDDASQEDLDGGRALVGMYRVSGTLGHGGMGVVYRAEHVALKKQVALKVLRPEAANDPAVASQFLVEARAACRAHHPGIVDVTDFGALPDGRSYLVMELVTWPTLAAILDEQGRLSVARAIAIARNVADALAAAAAHGVVHRDLTPSNIFVGEGDATKIADFGLARIDDPSSRAEPALGGLCGTAGYMSPEQGLGEPCDSRSDIYSLGVILFRIVAGKLPFDGRTFPELVARHVGDPVPRAVGMEGAAPDALQRVIERAMAKRPSERYQTVDEMLLALRELERTLVRSGWQRWLE
jgi:serine/threonine-protein kinase